MQPTYILTPSDLQGYEERDEFRLSDYFLILWRRKTLIVLGTLALGIAAFTLSQFQSQGYEARATLLVQRPTFTTELATQPLSVETYEALVNSGYVITSLRERLIADAKIGEEDSMGSLRTEIFASRLFQQPYSPIIDLVVEAPSAEKAQLVANAWADMFISVNFDLSVQGKEGAVEFIEAQYPSADLALKKEEARLLTRQDEYSRRLLALETSWTDRILDYSVETRLFEARKENEIARQTADFHTATQRMVEEHEKETERLVHEFRREWRPGRLKQELSVIESKRVAF
ncbi:MAG: hypothetical protein JSU96_14890, partial [Acidobacteriota bacterium]